MGKVKKDKVEKYYDLKVLDILIKNSDKEHPMIQDDIMKKLDTAEYGDTKIARKTLGQCLHYLMDCDWLPYKIKNVRNKGYYVAERPFENAELRILIDGVHSSRYMTEKTAQTLVGKLIEQGGKHFRPNVAFIRPANVATDDENEDENRKESERLFKTIDTIESAIENGKKISFWYSHYNENKELVKSNEHKDVSPYGLFVKNQRYYVAAYDGGLKVTSYFRVDKIQDIKMLNQSATDKHNKTELKNRDFAKEIAVLPYMYSDPVQGVKFYAEEAAIDHIVDYFGKSATISKKGEDRYYVQVTTSFQAMEYWALQYLKLVEIIYPSKLRENIIEDLNKGLKKYTPHKQDAAGRVPPVENARSSPENDKDE